MNTSSPKVVLLAILNTTATEVAVAHGGNGAVAVGVMYVPCSDVPEQAEGTVFAEDSPHEAGICPLRLATAVRKAA